MKTISQALSEEVLNLQLEYAALQQHADEMAKAAKDFFNPKALLKAVEDYEQFKKK